MLALKVRHAFLRLDALLVQLALGLLQRTLQLALLVLELLEVIQLGLVLVHRRRQFRNLGLVVQPQLLQLALQPIHCVLLLLF